LTAYPITSKYFRHQLFKCEGYISGETMLGTHEQGNIQELIRRVMCCVLMLTVIYTSFFAEHAHAQSSPKKGSQSLALVRDAEIEQLLREYSAPIFRAAGIPTGAAQIILVNSRVFNAFVANGRKIFINVGVLMDSKTPNEVIGVIAHESGHIAGGHLNRLREQVANAQILSVVGMLAGAAAIAGASAASDQVGNAGLGAIGVLSGSQDLVMRNLLAYQRTEEQAADRAAVRFLAASKQSPRGMLETFRRFADTQLFATSNLDPYLRSHPLPQERVASLETLVTESPYKDVKDSPALQARHDLARAKLFGFVDRYDGVIRRYPAYDTTLAARYARAIATYRQGRLSEALPLIDGLITSQPNNPYFHELKGQALLEGGRPQEAIAPLRQAVSRASSSGLIRILLGHALLATNNPRMIDDAIRELTAASQREPESPEVFRHLAVAYGQKGNIGLAEANLAQHYFLLGDWSNAQTQASRAMEKLPKTSPAWIRSEEILSYIPKAD
jgi:predicted Zn-dependent protease